MSRWTSSYQLYDGPQCDAHVWPESEPARHTHIRACACDPQLLCRMCAEPLCGETWVKGRIVVHREAS